MLAFKYGNLNGGFETCGLKTIWVFCNDEVFIKSLLHFAIKKKFVPSPTYKEKFQEC